jgi:hypothetical protein
MVLGGVGGSRCRAERDLVAQVVVLAHDPEKLLLPAPAAGSRRRHAGEPRAAQ